MIMKKVVGSKLATAHEENALSFGAEQYGKMTRTPCTRGRQISRFLNILGIFPFIFVMFIFRNYNLLLEVIKRHSKIFLNAAKSALPIPNLC